MDSSRLDSDYERGYEAGYEQAMKENADLEALRDRLNYLLKGGTWGQVDVKQLSKQETYIAGFEDAMMSLGMEVK